MRFVAFSEAEICKSMVRASTWKRKSFSKKRQKDQLRLQVVVFPLEVAPRFHIGSALEKRRSNDTKR